ncbi:MAG: hypothetical protein V1934_03885 [Methanobacteriota archaeon]
MEKAKKLAAFALAALMLASALAFPAESSDTSNTFFEDLAPGAPYNGYTFHDVAWTPDGAWALFVGTGGGFARAAWYNANTNTWSSAYAGTSTVILSSVCYDPSTTRFITLGNNAASGSIFYVTALGGTLQVGSNAQLAYVTINDMVYSTYAGGIIAVGKRVSPGTPTGPVAFRIATAGMSVNAYIDDTTAHPSGEWYGVDGYSNAFYFVGYGGDGYNLFHYTVAGTKYSGNMSVQGFFQDVAVDTSTTPMKLYIVAGSRNANVKGIWTTALSGSVPSTTLNGHGSIPQANQFYAVSMDKSGVSPGRAVIVGYNGSYGLVYDAWTDVSGSVRVAQRSSSIALFAAKQLRGVATRPSGIPFALVAGSAFKYSYMSAPSNIQVDTVVPHIAYIELYNAGTLTSKLNTQIDVDSGSGDLEYDLVVKAWSNAGQANIAQVNAYLWYDGGSNETFPSWGGSGFTSPGYENLRATFRWLRAGNAFSIEYPLTGETTLDVAACTFTDEPDLKNVTVKFRFCPRQQVRFADGPFGPEGPGMRYSFVPEGQTGSALNNFDSWNIQMTVWDIGASQANGFDEFGTFRYTYIGSAGLPGGGNLYGAGPPNTLITLSPGDENVTFSANCPYQLLLRITDMPGQTGPDTIPATALDAMGGANITSYTPFPGAGQPLCLIGAIAPNPVWFYYPQNTGLTTTTSNADFNGASWEPVMVRCNIPNVVEDRYLGIATYSVVHP